MPKLLPVTSKGQRVGWVFECLGCGGMHQIDSSWTFNDDVDRPTFTPSYLCWITEGPLAFRCHSYITDGQIRYLDDCTHKLAGQTVDLPDLR